MKMIKLLTLLSVLVAVLAQEYPFRHNFQNHPYQGVSVQYPYQANGQRRFINIQSQPIRNFITMNNGLEDIKNTGSLVENEDVKASVSSLHTTLVTKISSIAAKLHASLKTALKTVVVSIPAFIVGAVLVVGFCKVTSVCTKISSIQSLAEAQRQLSTYITPERLDVASEFLREAVRRYRAIQGN